MEPPIEIHQSRTEWTEATGCESLLFNVDALLPQFGQECPDNIRGGQG